MTDKTYSNWVNHLRYHNPFLEHNQKSCEACYLWSQGLIAFTGESIAVLNLKKRQSAPTKTKLTKESE